ncbi:hypothetical protein [Pseudomonas sp.]|uniref:hypothetical protein n=1 Tax=Pseudomonas sp. TaxID=306 RepID=UPI0028AEF1D1|nr:hypothetical protein [Pseudomonas sp.]
MKLRYLSLGLLLPLAGCSMIDRQSCVAQSYPAAVELPAEAGPPPRFGQGRWDPQLKMFVMNDAGDLYYRGQIYYRFAETWRWSDRPDGPWVEVDRAGVPDALASRYPQANRPRVLTTGFADAADRETAQAMPPSAAPATP